ncbi:MAG: hypothetical protein L6Q97_20325 [Thermoanaerobaculia bacterium]|nr:hypothetical protein [Thermoanaerobaculia bacterium]
MVLRQILPGKNLVLSLAGHFIVKVLNISIKLSFFGRRPKICNPQSAIRNPYALPGH